MMTRASRKWTMEQKIAWYGTRQEDTCLIWKGPLVWGYPRIRSGANKISVTRFVLSAKLGRPLREKFCACHSCDTPSCINPAHLFEGTHLDNMRDRDHKGRRAPPKGVLNGRSVLTEDKVRRIRRALAKGVTTVALAHHYGVSNVAIGKIGHRKMWSHVQ